MKGGDLYEFASTWTCPSAGLWRWDTAPSDRYL